MTRRYSGHETFPFRYAWLPKAVRAVQYSGLAFSDEEGAMVSLGLGKNMVRAARFWAEAAGMIAPEGKGLAVTPLGHELLLEGKLDPFLEDIQTLWLVHWMICTNPSPLAAWDHLLNKWHEPRLTKSLALAALRSLSESEDKTLSNVTLNQHFDVFLHTYVPTRSRKGEVQEDNLDSPLVELALLQPEIDVSVSGSSPEPSFSFRIDDKPEISSALFCWCLERFWKIAAKEEASLPFNLIAYGHGSPGQIFKLAEHGIRQRLEAISQDSGGRFAFIESSSIPHVAIHRNKPPIELVSIYQQDLSPSYA